MNDDLCLLTVHAHPDDESSKGAPTIARYHGEGVRTVLVCCTGGEAGDILNPAMDSDDVRARLPEIRREELIRAADIIGYDHVEWLGYRDSGMPGSPMNDDPSAFARVDAGEAVERLVRTIRAYRPQVIVTYGDDQELYPHPDHLRVHDITIPAYEAAGDPARYPYAGEPWAPSKLYYSVLSVTKLRMLHDTLLQMGVESPFPADWSAFPDNDDRITTRLDVEKWLDVRANALRAHATQIDPESPLWFGASSDSMRAIIATDDYVLARSSVETRIPEDDLFAGLR